MKLRLNDFQAQQLTATQANTLKGGITHPSGFVIPGTEQYNTWCEWWVGRGGNPDGAMMQFWYSVDVAWGLMEG